MPLSSITSDTGGGGQVDTVVGGTNVSVDATDPVNPIVNAVDQVKTLVAGAGITIDATDPVNPIVINSAGGGGDPTALRAIYTPGQHGYYTADDSGSSMEGTGLFSSTNAVDNSAFQTDDETGNQLVQSTDASIDDDARIAGASNIIQLNQLPLVVLKWRLVDILDVRFIAAIARSSGGITDDDDIDTDGIGIQFSTDRGDVNFQFLVNDNSSQTIVDTGIPVDTDPHFLQIDATAADNVTVRMLDNDFVVEASTVFNTVNPVLPTADTDMRLHVGMSTLAAAVKSIAQYYGSVLLRNA